MDIMNIMGNLIPGHNPRAVVAKLKKMHTRQLDEGVSGGSRQRDGTGGREIPRARRV